MFKDKWFVFDVEGDSLEPLLFHCLCFKGKDSSGEYTSYEDMREFLTNAEVLIGHNIARWDIPELERLLKIKIKARLIDTLAISWYLYPKRNRHGLESFGDEFKVPKPVVNNWSDLDISVYLNRCRTDVQINTILWETQYKTLLKLYEDEQGVDRLLRYLEFKMHCARLQEATKWKLDVDLTKKTLDKFIVEREEKIEQLREAMPKVAIKTKRLKPKVFRNKDGELSKRAKEYIDLCTSIYDTKGMGFGFDIPESIEVITGYNEPNPGSHEQIKEWLFSLGWKPETHKYVRDKKTNETRQIPQVSTEQTKEICPSVQKLYEKEPKLELLEGLNALTHRIGILQGFLRDERDGYLKARIQGLTNTMRFQHAEIVNLPRIDRPYAEEVRGSLICENVEFLLGADMSSLEDRLKQHFIFEFDPDYVKSMMKEGFDPHLDLAILAGEISEDEAELYKTLDNKKDKTEEERLSYTRIKKIRSIFKNTNYALI